MRIQMDTSASVVVVGLFLFCLTANGQDTLCQYLPDNFVVEVTCHYYKRCVNRRVEAMYCQFGLVLDKASLKCIVPGMGSTKCGLNMVCIGKSNGFYPDITPDGCPSFYFCLGERFVVRQYCPDDLVFDPDHLYCNYPDKVEAPCGTQRMI